MVDQNDDKFKRLPDYLQWILIFIDRAGFPVLAFFAILILTVYSMKNIKQTVDENTKALFAITQVTIEWRNEVRGVHDFQNTCLNSLMSDCHIKPRVK